MLEFTFKALRKLLNLLFRGKCFLRAHTDERFTDESDLPRLFAEALEIAGDLKVCQGTADVFVGWGGRDGLIQRLFASQPLKQESQGAILKRKFNAIVLHDG